MCCLVNYFAYLVKLALTSKINFGKEEHLFYSFKNSFSSAGVPWAMGHVGHNGGNVVWQYAQNQGFHVTYLGSCCYLENFTGFLLIIILLIITKKAGKDVKSSPWDPESSDPCPTELPLPAMALTPAQVALPCVPRWQPCCDPAPSFYISFFFHSLFSAPFSRSFPTPILGSDWQSLFGDTPKGQRNPERWALL